MSTSPPVGSAAIFGVVFGSSKAQTDGWGSTIALTPLIAGGHLLFGFVVLQKVDRHPLIPLRVLADRNRGAAYLTLLLGQAAADAGSPYAAWVLPGLILVRTGIGSAIVSAVAAGQQGVDPRDAGTAGALNNVSQQLGAALGEISGLF